MFCSYILLCSLPHVTNHTKEKLSELYSITKCEHVSLNLSTVMFSWEIYKYNLVHSFFETFHSQDLIVNSPIQLQHILS